MTIDARKLDALRHFLKNLNPSIMVVVKAGDIKDLIDAVDKAKAGTDFSKWDREPDPYAGISSGIFG